MGPGYLLGENTVTQVAVTALILALFVLARLLVGRFSRRHEAAPKRYRAKKRGDGIALFVLILALLYSWMPHRTEFLQVISIVGAGLLVALTGPITNLAGWVYIWLHKPFHLKDRIQVGGDLAGDVIDISYFQFSLIEIRNWVDADQSTGRIVHVPNAIVFQQAIANYTQGFQFIWNELPVTITFESNWERAHQIFTDLLDKFTADVQAEAQRQMKEASSRFMVYYTRLTPIVWVKVADHGVTLTLRYLCEARRRRGSETLIWMEVLRALAMESDIDLAYPTQRFYDNRSEGKPGTGGPPLDPAQPMMTESIPELSEMTMSIGNLQTVYKQTKAEVVLPGEDGEDGADVEELSLHEGEKTKDAGARKRSPGDAT